MSQKNPWEKSRLPPDPQPWRKEEEESAEGRWRMRSQRGEGEEVERTFFVRNFMSKGTDGETAHREN